MDKMIKTLRECKAYYDKDRWRAEVIDSNTIRFVNMPSTRSVEVRVSQRIVKPILKYYE